MKLLMISNSSKSVVKFRGQLIDSFLSRGIEVVVLLRESNDGFKIREYYKLPNSSFNFFTKKMIVCILNSLGFPQYLVNNRNKRLSSNEQKRYYQLILNNIILK